jgi:hypothetical protein
VSQDIWSEPSNPYEVRTTLNPSKHANGTINKGCNVRDLGATSTITPNRRRNANTQSTFGKESVASKRPANGPPQKLRLLSRPTCQLIKPPSFKSLGEYKNSKLLTMSGRLANFVT